MDEKGMGHRTVFHKLMSAPEDFDEVGMSIKYQLKHVGGVCQ